MDCNSNAAGLSLSASQPQAPVLLLVVMLLSLFLPGCAQMPTSGRTGAPTPRDLTISSDGHHFLKDSRSFFWMGDTVWQFLTHWDSSAAAIYLKDRQAKGFTVVQAFIAYDWNNTHCTVPVKNLHGDGPWLNDDPSTPNEAYFENVDHLVAQAASDDIVLALLPVDPACIVKAHVVNSENAFVYGKWLGNRFRSSPNIIWILGGDTAPTGYENVFDQLAAGLATGDRGSHLMTYHSGGENGDPYRPTSSSDFWEHTAWLNFNMIQYNGVVDFYRKLSSDYNLSPTRPTGCGEGAYEGSVYETSAGPTPPLTVRKQAYWAYLGGGYYTYGNHSIMTYHKNWAAHLNDPGARQMAILKKFFVSEGWQRLVPDQSIFKSGARTGVLQNAAARSQDGKTIIIYLSGPAAFRIDLSKITASSEIIATWFNPQTGAQNPIGTFATDGTRSFITPASMTDAVLLLDASHREEQK